MANTEAPNTLFSSTVFRVLDMLCEGPNGGFVQKPGPYGSDPLCATYYDDVPIRNSDGSYNWNVTGQGYSFDYTRGYSSQTGITGFQKVESIIPLSSNTRISNPPPGAGPFKPVIASFTTNTYPDADSIKVTVRVPALLAQDDQNNTSPYSIGYAVDVSVNNGEWLVLGLDSINGKCTQAYQRTTSYQLPKSSPPSAFYEWKVRVRRVTQNILSVRTQNEIFVDSICVVSTSLYAYPNTVLVGTQIGSDQFSNIPSRAYEIKGLLVSVPSGYTPTQYGFNATPFTRNAGVDAGIKHIVFNTQEQSQGDGITAGIAVTGVGIPANSVVTAINQGPPYFFTISQDPTISNTGIPITFFPTATEETITPAVYPGVWLGSFQTGVWTDNPAWVFYDLLTNPVHGLGDYIPAANVDKWSLYRVAQYCDQMVDDGDGGLEPRFTCNAVITQPQEAYNVLLNLASVFRGMLYYANGTIQVAQNQDDPPVYAFTNANVVDGAFNYSDTARNTRSTVAVVKWVDPQNGYRENVEYVEDPAGILRYGYQEKQMTAFATTSRGQAHRLGEWTLQTEQLLTETVTFQTSLEGMVMRPGDNFAVYDNFRNNRSQGGRIVSYDSTRSLITLDRPVTLDTGLVYSLSAIVPKFQLDGTGDVTGSNQIALIRQSQVETFQVVLPPTATTSQLLISGSFSSGLYQGSPFVLAASGDSNVYLSASFYTCLATAEVEPGKIEVLGLQANSGINFTIQSGYTTVAYPVNAGDSSSIQPPSNLRVTGITGANADNTFYSSINLTWNNTPDGNKLIGYEVSGKTFNGAWERAFVIDTGYNFTRSVTGQYLFKVAAQSIGGALSTFITGGIVIGTQNPLGTLRPLSGVRLVDNYDPLYVSPVANVGYTGFVGINPGFAWTAPVDNAGLPIVDVQFISGYRWNAQSFNGVTGFATGEISGAANTTFQFTGDLLRLFPGAPRGFDFVVKTIDIYGNVAAGASLKVDNPPMKVPFSSGFVGFGGGVVYNVTPSLQYDTSGIYLWASANPAFVPTYANYNYSSSNLAGSAQIAPATGAFYTWFALGDTFAAASNPIWGPVSGNTQAIVGDLFVNISGDIANAFAQLTGAFTNTMNLISGQGMLTLSQVNGLSGQVIGTTPGAANTALTVRVSTAVVATGQALSTDINAVSARVQLSGQQLTATVGTLSTALATTGGALSSWITQLGAYTSGQNSTVQIAARAFVTGDVNGVGGVAISTWGFKLDANGRVVTMQATAASGNDVVGSYGKIVFGNADLESSNYVTNSAGWRISANGNVEFGSGEFRGNLAAANSGVLIGRFGNYVNQPYIIFPNSDVVTDSSMLNVYQYHNDAVVANSSWAAGVVEMYETWRNGSSVLVEGLSATLSSRGLSFGSGGWGGAGLDTNLYRRAADLLATDDNLYVALDARISGQVYIGGSNLYVGPKNGGTVRVGGGPGSNAGISYQSGLGNAIAFTWDGLNVKVWVDGTAQGTIPNP